MELAQKQCTPCRGGIPPLKGDSLQTLFRKLENDWKIIDEHHLRTWVYVHADVSACARARAPGSLSEPARTSSDERPGALEHIGRRVDRAPPRHDSQLEDVWADDISQLDRNLCMVSLHALGDDTPFGRVAHNRVAEVQRPWIGSPHPPDDVADLLTL